MGKAGQQRGGTLTRVWSQAKSCRWREASSREPRREVPTVQVIAPIVPSQGSAFPQNQLSMWHKEDPGPQDCSPMKSPRAGCWKGSRQVEGGGNINHKEGSTAPGPELIDCSSSPLWPRFPICWDRHSSAGSSWPISEALCPSL